MTPQFRCCLVLLVIAITILSTPSLDRSAIEAQAPRPTAQQKNGARAELDQGRALLRRSQADQALSHLDSALQLYQQAGNPEGKAAANDALGDLYATQGQYQTALTYYQEAQKSFRDANKPSNAGIETAKIADVHMRMGNTDAARQAFAEMDSRRKNSGGAAGSGAGEGSASGTASGSGGSLSASVAPGRDGGAAGASGGSGGAGIVNAAGVAGGALACAALTPPQPPFQGAAPKTPDGLGKMDLRVQDQDGNPVPGAEVVLESSRPGRLQCDTRGTTDDLGRVIPLAIHMSNLTLKVKAPGYNPMQTSLTPESLGQPVQVTLQATKAVAGVGAAAMTVARTVACISLYQELVAQVAGAQGLGMAELLGHQLVAARGHFESLLGTVTGGGGAFGRFGVSKRARVAARTSLGDIAFLESRYGDALKLYTDAIKGAREDGRLDLVWAAQRGIGRTNWKLASAETEKNKVWKMRMEGISAYRDALKTIETIRRGSLRADDARTTFSSSTKDVFDEAAAALIEMAMNEPSTDGDLKGEALAYASEAFSIVEHGRARALLELLDESRAQITEGMPPELLKQRSDNLRRQQEIADQLFGLRLSDDAPPKAVADLDAELERLSTDFDKIENQIVAASPRYAALAAPKPLSVSAVQQRVLDDQTVLLEYNLGSEQSTLWVVTRSGLRVYRLPGRKVVEDLTLDFRKQLIPDGVTRPIAGIDAASNQGTKSSTRGLKVQAKGGADGSAEFARSGFALYKAAVAPAASQINDKRLLIVADGSLNYVPFEAFVTSETAGGDFSRLSYLITNHEIVYAPSATVVAVVRERPRSAAPRTALVLADPVFDASDPRAGGAAQAQGGGASRGLAIKTALTDIKGSPVQRVQIPRLDGTRVEAEKIAQLAKASGGTADVWLDLDANESRVISQDLRQYSLVHIATHGLLDAEHPQFTGLVLSLVGDRDHDGFLRAQEVFNLRLSGSLVMLSACETGLGKEKRGEGVIGLTRAFLYAGTPLVGVSLWSVADDSTAELMTNFYQGILSAKKPAAAALRDAQLQMISENRFNAPFFWAPFVLIGDWK
jgi:CHAT domain-containing protein